MIHVEDVGGSIQGMETDMMSLRDVVHTLFPPQWEGESQSPTLQDMWDRDEPSQIDVAHRICEYVLENPGRSKNAIIQQFKAEGFSHSTIMEAYHILIYDKKIIIRINVGTKSAPRYAHFTSPPFSPKPERDALYEVLGPL
ncbi:MAG: hypothetical protein HXS47_01550 [Theionarchaea archaeon]|nr:hypothetical protein [Theionarchaea archaeon]